MRITTRWSAGGYLSHFIFHQSGLLNGLCLQIERLAKGKSMQTAYSFFDLPYVVQKVTSQKGYRLTERELDVLEFVLEMKFSTLEDLHAKFFKVTKLGTVSNSLIWARQRVHKLVKSEMLQILTDVCARPLYVITQKGYLFLRNSRSQKNYCRPLLDVDGRFFDHDQRVAQVRIVLENSGVVKEWISERQLSEIDEYRKCLPTEFRPDAIYVTPEGKRVAFELEIARKTKERYQQKVKRYIHMMTAAPDAERLFEEVHYVCEKEAVWNLIQDHTQLFQPLFRFTMLSEVLGE